MKNIYCIVGPSGSGKTTLSEMLASKYGYRVIESYTTRPARFPGETGHIFVSPEEFKALGEMCAYTQFDGHEYGVTADLIDNNDLYVIDPAGLEHLREKYTGDKGIVVIGLSVERDTVIQRMRARGDSEEKIQRRLANDEKVFDSLYLISDKLVAVEDPVDDIVEYLHEWIGYVENDAPLHEFAIYDAAGRVVTDGKRFYSMNDSLWALKLAKETYPDGLPAGWEMRDETLARKAQYATTIKKCHPSFKLTGINVDIDNVMFTRTDGGHLCVPFTYLGKAYVYREHLNEGWIEPVQPRLSDVISTAESKRSQGDYSHEKKIQEPSL